MRVRPAGRAGGVGPWVRTISLDTNVTWFTGYLATGAHEPREAGLTPPEGKFCVPPHKISLHRRTMEGKFCMPTEILHVHTKFPLHNYLREILCAHAMPTQYFPSTTDSLRGHARPQYMVHEMKKLNVLAHFVQKSSLTTTQCTWNHSCHVLHHS